ncbi:C2 family cysteine protease [Floridanema aerugineum]|uniref:C2 family cysteine protease n=1 Tax=Floridaenema aerugineum BLCC-F46 TaxID=3153654 RepID=A0ABV4X2H2_9CYAN
MLLTLDSGCNEQNSLTEQSRETSIVPVGEMHLLRNSQKSNPGIGSDDLSINQNAYAIATGNGSTINNSFGQFVLSGVSGNGNLGENTQIQTNSQGNSNPISLNTDPITGNSISSVNGSTLGNNATSGTSTTSGNGATSGNSATTDAGNTMGTAVNWAPLNGWYRNSESIGSSDTNDYFKFSLTTRSDFNVILSGLSADADVRLLDQSGNQIISSANGGTHKIGGTAYSVSTSEAFNTILNAGTYFLRVNSYDGVSTQYTMDFLAKPTTTVSDWYSQNLKDSGIINWARQLGSDGQLSRSDMMLIFRSATDSTSVDSNELTDFRTLVNNSSRFQMIDSVRNLSNKIANGSTANALYQGQSLGNLYSGSSATQLDKLVGKWFLGNDLPSTFVPANGSTPARTISYGLANTSGLSGRNQLLYGTDGTINVTDIRQGYLGDCYFLAALGAFANNSQRASNVINNMFIDNGDGTFTVRFYGQNDGTVTTPADYITVNQYLPTTGGSQFAAYDNQNRGLWVALAEKAYAQFAEMGTSQRPSTANNYGSIEGGWGFRVMNSITGVTQGGVYANYSKVGTATPKGAFLSLSQISSFLSNNWALSAGTISNPGLGIVGGHEYTIVSANTSAGTVTLYNPWGPNSRTGESTGYRTLSYNDFKANFNLIDVG